MDLLTQGLTGASLAQSTAPREESRIAAGIGFAAGLLADADILIQSAEDPLLNLDYHRHFTHALFFIPVGALIASILLRPLLKRRLSFARLYRYSLLGYLLSGLLDACTSYGTHLLWPFSDARIAWNLISVVDPVFTGTLMIGTITAFYTKRAAFTRTGLLACGLYLAFAFVQQQRALDTARELARTRGHLPVRESEVDFKNGQSQERRVVKPSFANTIVWRSVYVANERVYVDAIRPALFGEARVYPGESLPLFRMVAAREGRPAAGGDANLAAIPPNSRLAGDIERFNYFSDGFIAIHPARPRVIGDIRYSMLPDSTLPMWGIEVNPVKAEEHAQFRAFRRMTREDRERFIAMVLGESVAARRNQ